MLNIWIDTAFLFGAARFFSIYTYSTFTVDAMSTSYIYLHYMPAIRAVMTFLISYASLLQLHMQCFALGVGGIFFFRSTDMEYMLDSRRSMC